MVEPLTSALPGTRPPRLPGKGELVHYLDISSEVHPAIVSRPIGIAGNVALHVFPHNRSCEFHRLVEYHDPAHAEVPGTWWFPSDEVRQVAGTEEVS